MATSSAERLANSGARRQRTRYSLVAVTFHWAIAALIIANGALGWWMDGAEGLAKFEAFQLHKSIGITVLLLSLGRLAWRLLNPPPAYPWQLSRLERVAAGAVHWSFYGFMVLMPLTGWLMASTSPLRLPTMLYESVPWPDFPGTATLGEGARAALNGPSDTAHWLLAWGAVLLLALHLGAVAKHMLIDRHPILRRMLPAFRNHDLPAKGPAE